jgi:hypothetical protein
MRSILSFAKLLFKLCLTGAILLVLIPPTYFVWRANQPMEMDQFGGQTYLEWIHLRSTAYDDLAQQYRITHPKQEVRNGICLSTELGVQIVVVIPNSGFYTLAGKYPPLQKYVNKADLRNRLLPQAVSWQDFLPAWWETFEKFVWAMAEHAPHGPVPYCRLSLNRACFARSPIRKDCAYRCKGLLDHRFTMHA